MGKIKRVVTCPLREVVVRGKKVMVGTCHGCVCGKKKGIPCDGKTCHCPRCDPSKEAPTLYRNMSLAKKKAYKVPEVDGFVVATSAKYSGEKRELARLSTDTVEGDKGERASRHAKKARSEKACLGKLSFGQDGEEVHYLDKFLKGAKPELPPSYLPQWDRTAEGENAAHCQGGSAIAEEALRRKGCENFAAIPNRM
jgi:hypothetical protein